MTGDKRRAHHKSRLGCKNCKGRKIKCDETKPACLNCVKRNAECDFLSAESPRPSPSPGGLNMTDLELLHNYTTITYATLSESLALREFYRTSVVQMGFGCDYIMRAILAISSLHLARHRPHMKDHYVAVAIVHYQEASSLATPLVANVSPDTAPMLFLFSVLTTYYTLGWPRKSDDILLLGESSFPGWVFLLRGTRVFVQIVGSLHEGPLSPIFNHAISRFVSRDSAADKDSPAHVPLSELKGIIMQRPLAEELKTAYANSIKELMSTFGQLQQNTPAFELVDAFIWLAMVADDLLPLLQVQTPESVAIFAFFCVLLKKLDSHWWVQGWGEQLIARAYSLLDEESRLWIRWPIEEIGWIPPSVIA